MKQNRLPYSPHLAEDPTVEQRLSVSQSPSEQQAIGFVFYKQTRRKFRLKQSPQRKKNRNQAAGTLHIPKGFFL